MLCCERLQLCELASVGAWLLPTGLLPQIGTGVGGVGICGSGVTVAGTWLDRHQRTGKTDVSVERSARARA